MIDKTMKLSDIITTPVVPTGTEDPIGRVADVAVRAGQAHLDFVLVNMSVTGGYDPVVFSADTLELGVGQVTCAYSQEQIEQLRHRKTEESHLPVGIEGLPPLVVGPFGNAIAPVVMGAVLNDALHDRPKPIPSERDCRWFTELQGNPAFDATGELGTLLDVEIDPTSKALRFLLIDRGSDTLSIPFAELRNIPDGEHYVVLSRSSDPLRPV
ncbi:hypothetical protein SL1157_2257 [Ruegeria lacuscaerulensis ITI-1157]|nr:hypothetical protein SL1157_2257 [Ruegeria lacuscaerulensis ITI-1157]